MYSRSLLGSQGLDVHPPLHLVAWSPPLPSPSLFLSACKEGNELLLFHSCKLWDIFILSGFSLLLPPLLPLSPLFLLLPLTHTLSRRVGEWRRLCIADCVRHCNRTHCRGWEHSTNFPCPLSPAGISISLSLSLPLLFISPSPSLALFLTYHFLSLQGCETISLHCRRDVNRSISWIVGNQQFEVNESHAEYDLIGQKDASLRKIAYGMAEFGYSKRYPRPLLSKDGEIESVKLKIE